MYKDEIHNILMQILYFCFQNKQCMLDFSFRAALHVQEELIQFTHVSKY
jgi:hypothetical protein